VGFSRKATVQSHVVDVGTPGLISASLTWGGKADLNLYLYGPAGDLVASSAARSRGGSEEISYVGGEAGVYVFEVVAAAGKANYTLTVTHP